MGKRREDEEVEKMACRIDEMAKVATRGKLIQRAGRLKDTARTLRWTLGEEEALVTDDGLMERVPE